MGKIIFLGDLHGNMPATEAMAREIENIKPDIVWFMGDAVGKGPESDKTCDWVRNNCDRFISGNWDLGMYENFRTREFPTDKPYWDQIGEERLNWLASLPQEDSVWISGYHFRLIHGRPIDQLYFDFDSEEKYNKGLVSSDRKTTYTGLIAADCHKPYVRNTTKGYIMNTGSVGDSLGQTNAHALLVEGDIDSRERSSIRMTILSVPYDNARAVAITEEHKEIPRWESFRTEILTGIYSR